MSADEEAEAYHNISVDHISIIGCTLSIVNQTAFVNSRTKSLLSVQPNAAKMQSEWRAWNPPTSNGTGLFPDQQIDLVSRRLSKLIIG